MTEQHRPYGNGVTHPTELDPAEFVEAVEAAANRFELWLAFADQNRPGMDHIHQVSYERFPIGDADLKLLLADYRFHRPTQWAYDRACEAIEKHRQRADTAESELAALKATVPCGRSIVHPPHKHMTGRKVYQCAGVASEES